MWLYVTGNWPENQIDHLNHKRRDNRFENLRDVNNQINHFNRPMQASNTSGFVGVSFQKATKSFEAYINIAKKKIRLGRFKNLIDAIDARKEANIKYGFHENHGIGLGIPKKPTMSNKRGRPSIRVIDKVK